MVEASGRTLSRLFHDEHGHHTAHACGWADLGGFIEAFTQVIGTTPGRYRISAPASHRDVAS